MDRLSQCILAKFHRQIVLLKYQQNRVNKDLGWDHRGLRRPSELATQKGLPLPSVAANVAMSTPSTPAATPQEQRCRLFQIGQVARSQQPQPSASTGVGGNDRHRGRGKGIAMSSKTRSERTHDRTLEESFPASDPAANSGITGSEQPDKSPDQRSIQEQPTGTPTSDRHAVETAHHRENESKPSTKR